MTQSVTRTASFTITDARYVATKMGADLRNLNSLYGSPALSTIDNYVEESAVLLNAGYLNTVDFGFKSGDQWKLRLRYSATISGQLRDDPPGRLPHALHIAGLSFYSYLIYSTKFHALPYATRKAFTDALPITRGGADEPGLGTSALGTSASYARNGQGLSRDVHSAY